MNKTPRRINKHTSLSLSLSGDQPVFQRCTTCGPAACWSPPSFPSSPACLGQTPRCRHMADTPGVRCCGTGGTTRYMTSRHGARSHVACATPAAPTSGWQLRPHCEALKGHLWRDDRRVKGVWHWKYMFPMSASNEADINQVNSDQSVSLKQLHAIKFIMVST